MNEIKTTLRKSLCLVLGILLIGCVTLQSVSITQIPLKRKRKISVEETKIVFLSISFNNDFADLVSKRLQKKCSKGRVQGILTKYEWVTYFPLILGKARISAEGFCLRGS